MMPHQSNLLRGTAGPEKSGWGVCRRGKCTLPPENVALQWVIMSAWFYELLAGGDFRGWGIG